MQKINKKVSLDKILYYTILYLINLKNKNKEMKKLIFILWLFFSFAFFVSAWNIQFVQWIATGDNINLNFDASWSKVFIDLSDFKWNVCWLNYSWYELSWYVDTEIAWYVYFSNNDNNSVVNSCVWLVLSWSDWYVKWTWAMNIDSWSTIYFDGIKLIWKDTDKRYYFSWQAITSSVWKVEKFDWVYISWLDLIDWTKTLVDYSDCKNWIIYANWQSCNLKIRLRNSWWLPVNSLYSINASIDSVNSDYNNKIFLTTWWKTFSTFPVTNWTINIPIYILKPASWLNLNIKLGYSVFSVNGNDEKILTLTGIKILNPIKQVGFSNISANIIWESTSWNYNLQFYSTGLLNNFNKFNFIWSLSVIWTWSDKYAFSWWTSNQNWNVFSFVIYPKDINYNQSVVDVTIYTWKVIYDFDSYFNGATGEYDFSLENEPNVRLYADKRVDWWKSEIVWLDFSWNDFKAIDSTNYPKFKFILRNYKWYIIPDVSVDLLFKDNGIANSYSWWDCDEIQIWYQTDCKWLLFDYSWNYYSWVLDWKLWAYFDYLASGSNFKDIWIVSLKPITWDSSIYFKIRNIKNTSSLWSSFENSGSYIWMSLKTGNIVNLHYLPSLNLDLRWLDEDDNYIDINNEIYVWLENTSNINLYDVSYNLSWEIIFPTDGSVNFTTWYWDILTGSTWLILSNNDYKSLSKVLLKISYFYDSWVVLNYNYGSYTYNIKNFEWINIWKFNLKPWNFWFNLWAKYKFGWVFVLWLINKVEKRTASVKNVIWRWNWSSAIVGLSFVDIYNKLLKKAYKLSAWLNKENTFSINPNYLSWWIKYYRCNDNEIITIWTWTYEWNNTLLVENCRILIKWNIYKSSTWDNLIIFAYSMKDKYDISNPNYLDNYSNIFIAENVSDIQASLLTKWTIITINGDVVNDNNIITSSRTYTINDKQLTIFGSIMSKNTIGWSFLIKWTNDSYYSVLPWWKKIYKNDNLRWYTDLLEKEKIFQIFDVNFFRGVKLWNWSFSYDPNWFSYYCKDFWSNMPEKCKYPVLIIYDPSYKQSDLFK